MKAALLVATGVIAGFALGFIPFQGGDLRIKDGVNPLQSCYQAPADVGVSTGTAVQMSQNLLSWYRQHTQLLADGSLRRDNGETEADLRTLEEMLASDIDVTDQEIESFFETQASTWPAGTSLSTVAPGIRRLLAGQRLQERVKSLRSGVAIDEEEVALCPPHLNLPAALLPMTGAVEATSHIMWIANLGDENFVEEWTRANKLLDQGGNAIKTTYLVGDLSSGARNIDLFKLQLCVIDQGPGKIRELLNLLAKKQIITESSTTVSAAVSQLNLNKDVFSGCMNRSEATERAQWWAKFSEKVLAGGASSLFLNQRLVLARDAVASVTKVLNF